MYNVPFQRAFCAQKSPVPRILRLVLLGLLLLSSCGSSGPAASNKPSRIPPGKIKHIVFFIKENRTFDNYFGTYPGADGATTARDSQGQVVPLHHEKDQIPDINHSWQSAKTAYDNGKM